MQKLTYHSKFGVPQKQFVFNESVLKLRQNLKVREEQRKSLENIGRMNS